MPWRISIRLHDTMSCHRNAETDAMFSAQSSERPDDGQGQHWITLELEQMVQAGQPGQVQKGARIEILALVIFRLKLQSPPHCWQQLGTARPGERRPFCM